MRDYYEQARVSLRVYLERSRKLLRDIDQGNLNGLESLLRMKTAAFHNFRAAEAILQSSGIEVGRDPEFLALWQDIAQTDKELDAVLQMLKEEFQEELARSQRVRLNIGKYRSGLQVRSAFEKAI